MARSTWSLLIGMLSTFMYTCLTLFNIVYLLYMCGYIPQSLIEESSDVPEGSKLNFKNFNSKTNIYLIAFETIVFVVMIVVSILLQVGVKRERPQFLRPWLCVTGVAIASAVLGLVFCRGFSDVQFILDILIILLPTVMWYPIFVHYKEMRHQERLHLESCDRQRNGAAYYIGRTSNSVYAPTTEFVNTSWSETFP